MEHSRPESDVRIFGLAKEHHARDELEPVDERRLVLGEGEQEPAQAKRKRKRKRKPEEDVSARQASELKKED
jgi:hypothetical protein